MTNIEPKRVVVVAIAVASLACAATTASAKKLGVTWMPGYRVPGTPAKYNKVGVIKVGPASAKNILVLEPGTQAGGGYFIPLAEWLSSKLKGWQVWSVERRENLLEDQSELNLAKQHKATAVQVYNYFFGSDRKHHFQPVLNSTVELAKQWGLSVAVQDVHRVIEAAKKLGGKVVLGGHSLGGAFVTAYATWDFNGRAGADDLAGLVYDDGASSPKAVSAQHAKNDLRTLDAASSSPWLNAGGIPAPYIGLFGSAGALAAIQEPNAPSLAQQTGLLKAVGLAPPVPATNLAIFGWNTDVNTSKLVFAFQAHLGKGLAARPVNGLYGWDSSGALTPIERWATMLAGPELSDADGLEWYFPDRLWIDALQDPAIDQGNANPAQRVLGLKSTMGHHLPKRLLMYAFGAYGGAAITAATTQLASQSHIPRSNLTLISRHGTYAHNDPAGAWPHNAFFDHLVQFLKKVATGR